jgi:DNA polymerase (family X)
MANQPVSNKDIANTLNRIAELLEAQDGQEFRIRAYRNAANTIRDHETPLAQTLHEGGVEALQVIPNIGERLAPLIAEFVNTGRSTLLERLEGEVAPEDVFVRVPGIGAELAHRIVETLHIDSLEELEQAANDGRLEEIEGFGERRVEGIRMALAGMLRRSSRNREPQQQQEDNTRPSVKLLLEIDAEYRRKGEAGELRQIAPKRFNPDNDAWLPVMHIERDGWDITALFSNTARAHELNRTRDWVVIYYERDYTEGQRTIVTETSGPLKDKRVVRGREEETRRYYETEAEG